LQKVGRSKKRKTRTRFIARTKKKETKRENLTKDFELGKPWCDKKASDAEKIARRRQKMAKRQNRGKGFAGSAKHGHTKTK